MIEEVQDLYEIAYFQPEVEQRQERKRHSLKKTRTREVINNKQMIDLQQRLNQSQQDAWPTVQSNIVSDEMTALKL